MPRIAPAMASAMISNPYPKPKDTQPLITICEVCDNREVRTKDWNSHKNSKKHRQNEEALRKKENQAITGDKEASGGDWNPNGCVSNGFEAPSWGEANSDSGNRLGGSKFNGACYGCGEEGHSKRDCPKTGGGGRGCFNCGETG